MKRLNRKTVVLAAVALLLGGGAYLNYMQAQPREQLSDLTLANIELFAAPCQDNIDIVGSVITVTVCERTTSIIDGLLKIPCGSTSSGSCTFNNMK